ncbi:MAG TPA: S41 family peptidase [Vicinamibacteria bacterium]|nr:S41 family peptidase [Vicinamibacteria bacterium]
MSRWAKAVAVACVLLVWSCAGEGLRDLFQECDKKGQNAFVRDTMKDIYLWYRELPDLDPAAYDSPEAYLEAMRYQRYDTHFSFITGKEEDKAYYSDSQFVGMGIGTSQTSSSELRISQVFPDSPASEAGLSRGDYVLTINGKAVADLIRTGEIGNAFGPSEVGVAVDLVWRDMDGRQKSATLKKRLVTIPTVSMTKVYDLGNRRVGYIFFRNFVKPSVDALDRAFGELGDQGVSELVLDLRYNGGGMTSVALHLGGLIGGVRTKGEVFTKFSHNDKNKSKDTTDRFEDPAKALDLSRLTVITTDGSASASEAVINGLEPFIPVTVVGDTTYGKPVGQYGYNFCDKVLYPVSFKVVNARDQGDYFDGIPVDCPAVDDLDHQLGDPAEASLAEALSFVGSGSCSGRRAAAASALSRRHAEIGKPARRLDGWRQLIGAY